MAQYIMFKEFIFADTINLHLFKYEIFKERVGEIMFDSWPYLCDDEKLISTNT